MINSEASNIIAEIIVKEFGGCFLDRNNILWKLIKGEWVGKRSVFTFDFKNCWLEDVKNENIKNWWHNDKSADYSELFYRK